MIYFNRIVLSGLILLLLSTVQSCKFKSDNFALQPEKFQEAIHQPDITLVDVRTPEEYAGGHIPGAINISFSSEQFGTLINALPKGKSVYLYCLSGARSASAAAVFGEKGFTRIYDLEGGLLAWRNAHLPLEQGIKIAETSAATGNASFEQQIKSADLVLVDFYAEWCGPCKKLEPELAALKSSHPAVKVIRIDVDQQPDLAEKMGISQIPFMQLYRKGSVSWSNTGFITHDELVKAAGL